ncbi:MAG: hypothetical protein J3K34DRAFT_433107 [Monoraphidium minutum]|nr:MAG: hypothetical protein J3K34DRAFT_433107 [Monoraphidium minutum]
MPFLSPPRPRRLFAGARLWHPLVYPMRRDAASVRFKNYRHPPLCRSRRRLLHPALTARARPSPRAAPALAAPTKAAARAAPPRGPLLPGRRPPAAAAAPRRPVAAGGRRLPRRGPRFGFESLRRTTHDRHGRDRAHHERPPLAALARGKTRGPWTDPPWTKPRNRNGTRWLLACIAARLHEPRRPAPLAPAPEWQGQRRPRNSGACGPRTRAPAAGRRAFAAGSAPRAPRP